MPLTLESILFIDMEPYSFRDPEKKVSEVGIILDKVQHKSHSLSAIRKALSHKEPKILCGHNIRNFDLSYLEQSPLAHFGHLPILDTLELSALLLPARQIHALNKSYKDNGIEPVNDPLEDVLLTRTLLINVVQTFLQLPSKYKNWLRSLLEKSKKFQPFFQLIDLPHNPITSPENFYQQLIEDKGLGIANATALNEILHESPELLAHILTHRCPNLKIQNISPYVRKCYPAIDECINRLFFNPESEIQLLPDSAREYFGYTSFKEFPKPGKDDLFELDSKKLSQREIIESSLRRESLLAILPTGGGKTFCFWLPAVIKARKTKALTVVISPLQALIQDHLGNFNQQLHDHFQAASLSNITSKPKRRKILDDVRYGYVDLFYVTPESLRFKTVENALKQRYIERFVIDEAHCITGWGHVFRHDFFYIATFIQRVTDNKYREGIPISLFTATATQACQQEIRNYISKSMNVPIKEFIADSRRTNLNYMAQSFDDEKGKMNRLLHLLKNEKQASLIYNPTSTKKCEEIAEHLADTLSKEIVPFHAQLEDSSLRPKILQQFIADEVFGIVATTAFGMGIDKANIRNVIHMSLSPSLEEYMQESGRAGRDGEHSNCISLFTDKDFDDLFFRLIRSRINQAEIRKVFQEIKRHKGRKVGQERKIYLSAHSIAEAIGTDDENQDEESKTRVQTAILELERCGYLRRGLNDPGVKVTSVHIRSIDEFNRWMDKNAIKIENSLTDLLSQLMPKLLMKSTYQYTLTELAEYLNVEKEELLEALEFLKSNNLVKLREDLEIIPLPLFQKLLKALSTLSQSINSILKICRIFNQRRFSLPELTIQFSQIFPVADGDEVRFTRSFFLLLRKSGILRFRKVQVSRSLYELHVENYDTLTAHLRTITQTLTQTAQQLLIFSKLRSDAKQNIQFAYYDLCDTISKNLGKKITISELDSIFVFLEKVRCLRLGGGKLVHNMQMELYLPLDLSPRKQYTHDDFSKRMEPMYQAQLESIHALQFYMECLQDSPSRAQDFASDYFSLSKQELIRKYDLTKRFRLPVSQKKYDQIMLQLTPEQKTIVTDHKMKSAMIFAGPGTGKTSVLIKKIAHMIVEEGHRPNHFIMLTFTRSACHEFRSRLYQLLGHLAHQIGVYTFHGYACQLMSWNEKNKDVDLERIIPIITEKIRAGHIEIPLKTVLVLDEFQDITPDTFAFVETLYDQLSGRIGTRQESTDLKLLAVGDDDQCIMELTTGANVSFIEKYLQAFGPNRNNPEVNRYPLSYNFRSGSNIVEFCETFAHNIQTREKGDQPMNSHKNDPGEVILHQYKSSYCIQTITKIIEENYDPDRHYTLAILTHTNEQVLALYSLLKSNPLLANDIHLLLQQDGFPISMLNEIRHFTQYLEKHIGTESHFISPHLFNEAIANLNQQFQDSSKLDSVLRHINDFQKRHQDLTLSYWLSYISEVQIEQFDTDQSSRIVISTIHRAKGKEFDEVHVVIPEKHHQDQPDYFFRLYYVALSRAKKSLHIHSGDNNLFRPLLRKCQKVHHHESSPKPESIHQIWIMTLQDINLGFLQRSENKDRLRYVQKEQILSGEEVTLNHYESEGKWNIVRQKTAIAQLSNNFTQRLEKALKTHKLLTATIEYTAHWQSPESSLESPIFLYRLELQPQ